MVSTAVVNEFAIMYAICHVVNVIDFNECGNGTNSNCESRNAECNNTFGSFECYCRDGYRDNGTYCESM